MISRDRMKEKFGIAQIFKDTEMDIMIVFDDSGDRDTFVKDIAARFNIPMSYIDKAMSGCITCYRPTVSRCEICGALRCNVCRQDGVHECSTEGPVEGLMTSVANTIDGHVTHLRKMIEESATSQDDIDAVVKELGWLSDLANILRAEDQ